MLAVQEGDEVFVGKVCQVGVTIFEMILYTAALSGTWAPVEMPGGKRFPKTFPKESIKDDMFFYLASAGELPPSAKSTLSRIMH